MKKAALVYLANGPEAVTQLRKSLYVSTSFPSTRYGSNTAVVLEPPRGLTAEALRPLLAGGDPADAACAGYLLCLLGDRAGLDPLVTYYREHGRQDHGLRRLVFRAVAAIGDDSLVPILDEAYKDSEGDSYDVREYYWTIRTMNGPNVLKLRKQIRDTVGMDQLR